MHSWEQRNKIAPGVSRRDFLKGSGAVAAATAMGSSAALANDGAGAAVSGPGAAAVTLNVNGKTHRLELEPRVTLLSALRNDLDLTGAKPACDRGGCGACTVLLDGKPVEACSVLAVDAQGKKITTVEALGGASPDAVPTAFVHHDGLQCGFCTPGFVVAVRAFVDQNPGATLDDVRKGLNGNICRCGTYAGVATAALEAARKGGGANG
jgi:xanthine dehydrogenase YagT iron-sulfur-binding subunit